LLLISTFRLEERGGGGRGWEGVVRGWRLEIFEGKGVFGGLKIGTKQHG
jgi:hypothetical protein